MNKTTIIEYLKEFHSIDALLVCTVNDCGVQGIEITEVNEVAADLLGYSHEELTTMNLRAIALGLPPLENMVGMSQKRVAAEFLHKCGSRIPVEMDIHPAHDDASQGWLIVSRPLSERKQLEAELERTRMEREDAWKVKSRFLANMSHELRTPLNGIMGMTQILLGSELTSDQKEYLDLSLDATRQLTRILNDLLELSSIENGGLTLYPVTFPLHEMVKKLTRSSLPQAKDKGLSLICNIAEDVPETVRGDMVKIRQVLVNLLINAIKFTESGSITLSVGGSGTSCKNEGLYEVCFAVSDTGVGIPPEQLDTIFESFTLGESIMTKQYGGMGLGLTISRHLAEFMGGTIAVESQPGAGSTFTFTIPLEVQSDFSAQLFASADISAQETDQLRILLAEDEQVNSIMASRLLRKAGHAVAVVGNGQEALDALGRSPYDLILMDVQMPIINGEQATRFIRSGAVENVSTDIPIIGLTAFAQPEEKKRFLDAGMNRIVTKPYEPEELMLAVATSTHAG